MDRPKAKNARQVYPFLISHYSFLTYHFPITFLVLPSAVRMMFSPLPICRR